MIKEKCSCGAEIHVEYRETSWQTATVNKWRIEHKHDDTLKTDRDELYQQKLEAEINAEKENKKVVTNYDPKCV